MSAIFVNKHFYTKESIILVVLFMLALILLGCSSGGSSDSGYAKCSTNPVYVHPSGSDSNIGSRTEPFATIGKALSCAYEQEVRVAEGVYDVLSSMTLQGDSPLLGGYSSDFSVRDPVTYPTIVNAYTNTGPVIKALYGEGQLGRIDGFIFHDNSLVDHIFIESYILVSNNTLYCTGMCIYGGAAHDNTLYGGNGNVVIRASNVMRNIISTDAVNATGVDILMGGYGQIYRPYGVKGNTIELTAGGKAIMGGYNVPIDIESNMINIVDGIGIFDISDVTSNVRNNVIFLSGTATGINDSGLSTIISNNTIIGEAGGDYVGVLAVGSGGSYMNNVISFSNGSCISEYSVSHDPVVVKNNDLTGCPTIYLDEASVGLTSISSVNAMADTSASGNIRIDAALDITDGRLTAGSPVSVSQGGLDLSGDYTTDKLGVTRTVPWSIGAYEYD